MKLELFYNDTIEILYSIIDVTPYNIDDNLKRLYELGCYINFHNKYNNKLHYVFDDILYISRLFKKDDSIKYGMLYKNNIYDNNIVLLNDYIDCIKDLIKQL